MGAILIDLDFRKDDKYAAVAERRDGKDFIGVYDCRQDWAMVKVPGLLRCLQFVRIATCSCSNFCLL